MVDRMINAGTWSGAFISAFGALTINQWLAIGGFCLAAAGFLVNFWFKSVSYTHLRAHET